MPGRRAGISRSSASPALLLHMLRAKAEEAGLAWLKVPTRTVKRSQTCSACGRQERKPLAQRVHRCACGTVLGRDENAARVMLNWALSASDREPARCGGRSGPVEARNSTRSSCSGGVGSSHPDHPSCAPTSSLRGRLLGTFAWRCHRPRARTRWWRRSRLRRWRCIGRRRIRLRRWRSRFRRWRWRNRIRSESLRR